LKVATGLLDDEATAAIAVSSLGSLPGDALVALTFGATRLRIPARSMIHVEGEQAPHLELVISGLVRVRTSATDGRMLTVRYCRSGALLGVATLYAPVQRPFDVQAASESELLSLRPDVVRARADQDPRVAGALLVETSQRVMTFVAEFSGHAFASVRQRVARHLMDLALDQQRTGELVASISQQELADAVGTVREVVVRILRELREAGAVQTGREGIMIRDADLLARAESPTWNESP
jgi:CRP/FNR family transcriptional regulator, cyclic AMP receptor protein